MARHGIEYNTVKQTALKLLSKNISPSVQKVRELLGTGSNSTIAEHLKNWREEHAAKKIHHLPATLPEELVATFETLWQTAMEHAEKQMTDVKEALEQQEEKLQQEKTLTDKMIAELKSQSGELTQKIDTKMQENFALQTKLAVSDERLEKQIRETDRIEQQYELRLKHLLGEKHQAIEKIDQLQNEISRQQQDLSAQSEKYQAMLEKERSLQENSEERWAQLIDQARSETQGLRKKYEEKVRSQATQIESLQNSLLKSREKTTTMQVSLDHKNDTIETLKKQMSELQTQHTAVVSEFAVMQAERKAIISKKSVKKITETV
jgi:chromosome segregation ATPase